MPAEVLRKAAGLALIVGIAATSLAGCRDKAQTPASRASVSAADGERLRADYARCRNVAGSDAAALTKCSDSAIAAVVALLPDGASLTAGTDVMRQLGDAGIKYLGEESQALRVGVADALAQMAIERVLLLAGGSLDQSPGAKAIPASMSAIWSPFATAECRQSASATCGPEQQRLFARFVARLDALKAPSNDDPATTPRLASYEPPGCAAVRAAASADAALAQFEREFPAALKDQKLIETLALNDSQLSGISAYLACLAQRSSYGPDVVETSLWLFSSKRHGKRASKLLDRLAAGKGEDAAAAREFASQIRDYLDQAGQ